MLGKETGDSMVGWLFCFFLFMRKISDHFMGKSIGNIVSNSYVG